MLCCAAPAIFAQSVLPQCPATFTNLSASYVVATTGQGTVSGNYITGLSNPYAKVGVVDGRHTLITKQGTDPNTGGALPLLPAGETQVIRLGNSNVNAEAEAIAYHFIVDKDHTVLLLKFAVVLEDPGHSAINQPRFVVSIKDKDGNLIESCSEYNVSAAANIPGFKTYNKSYSSPVRWRPWTNVGIDLSGFIGREVSVEFATYDCAQWGHFGYAYFTAKCISNYLQMSNCTGGTYTLEAPADFASYRWDNGDQTQTSVRTTAGGNNTDVSCLVTSATGCQFTLYGRITNTTPAQTHISDTICEGESYNLHDFNLPPQTETGEKLYYTTYLNPTNCNDDNTVELSLLVVPRYVKIEAEICQGSDYIGEGFNIVQPSPGIRYDTIATGNFSGCKTYKCLKLKVNLALNLPNAINGDPTPCTGELSTYSFAGSETMTSYEWQLPSNAVVSGRSSSSITVYFTDDMPGNIVLKGKNGCGTGSTSLAVSPKRAYDLYFSENICVGEYYNNHNINLGRQDSTGYFVYSRQLHSSAGCDSTVTLALSVSPIPEFEIVASDTIVCNAGDSVSLLANTSGKNVVLTKPMNAASIFILDCGLKYLWNTGDTTATITVNPLNTTTYTCTVTSSSGCSVRQSKQIVVKTASSQVINAVICAGETYTAYGFNAKNTGTYSNTFTQNGCNVPVKLNLTVNKRYEQTFYGTICEGSTYNEHGFHLTPYQTGIITETLNLQSVTGCDSIVHLQLTVNPVQTVSVYDTICQNMPYTQNGFNLPVQKIPGKFIYKHSVSTPQNCINTTVLYLTVNPLVENIISDEAILGSRYRSYNFNEILNKSGLQTYTQTLRSVKTGCDSTVILNLKVIKTSSTTALSDTICSGESYSFGGKSYTVAGEYADTLVSVLGNDSIVTLSLAVNPIYIDTITHSICAGQSYQFNGNNYRESGFYTANLKTVLGCDSIVTLSLNVKPLNTKTINAEIYANKTYNFYGTILNIANTYIDTIPGVVECDTIVTLHLTVNPVNTKDVTAAICTGESYNFGGINYTVSGEYVDSLLDASGNDSIVTLNLTVNPIYNDTITHSICSGESYLFNGNNYRESGFYTAKLKTVFGCDSIVTLILSVNDKKNTEFSDTVEMGKNYTKNGFNLPIQTEAGVFTFRLKLQTIHGCDSTVTLTLKVAAALKIEILPIADICANDRSFEILYNVIAGKALYSSVLFDNKAQTEGFVNNESTPVANQSIIIVVPENVQPDNYSVTVKFFDEELQEEYTIPFTVLCPNSIIIQKWNDVLALLNSDYNGGFKFSSYQWYKNGQPIEGATKSYYVADGNLDMNATYSVRLVRIDNEVELFSCPFTPTLHNEINIYPTILQKSSNIVVETENSCQANLMSLTGIKIKQQLLESGINNIIAPDCSGSYLLVISDELYGSRKQLLIVK